MKCHWAKMADATSQRLSSVHIMPNLIALMHKSFNHVDPVLAAKNFFTGSFWMWHKTKDIFIFVADASNSVYTSVWIVITALSVTILKYDLVVVIHLFEFVRFDKIVTLRMCYGNIEHIPLFGLTKKYIIVMEHLDVLEFGDEMEVFISHHSAWEHMGF